MKFSIVTPAYNSERWIRETIESVIGQRGDFSIEYVVVDNCSTDATPAIVDEYRDALASGRYAIRCRDVQLHLYSERDRGMYDAIRNGFARTTGDVQAWINSDDCYLPGAFDAVRRTFERYPQVTWLKGVCCWMNVHSNIFVAGDCALFRQDFIRAGLYGPVLRFIDQESVFWRSDLWRQSGGVDPTLKLAGDYFLWKSFARIAPLHSLNVLVSCFRRSPDQKSASLDAYLGEIDRVEPADRALTARHRHYQRRIDRLPHRLRRFASRRIFGVAAHHLVMLDDEGRPRLMEDDDADALGRLARQGTVPAAEDHT